MIKLLGICIGLFGIVFAIGGPIYHKIPWREAWPIYITVPVFVFTTGFAAGIW